MGRGLTGVRTLAGASDLDDFLAGPGPRWILKHSAICPVSDRALAEVEAFARGRPGAAVALVVVQEARPLSNLLSERTGVRHETPQALLFLDGRVAWHASHAAVTAKAMMAAEGP